MDPKLQLVCTLLVPLLLWSIACACRRHFELSGREKAAKTAIVAGIGICALAAVVNLVAGSLHGDSLLVVIALPFGWLGWNDYQTSYG